MAFTPNPDNPATVVTGQTALATWANARTHRTLNVLDYGATADGVTNDMPAVALALADGENHRIYFPPATYVFSWDSLAEMLIVPDNCHIFFDNAVVKFDYNGLPMFNFINCDRSGISGRVKFLFTGTSQTTNDFTKAQYMTQIGWTTMDSFGGHYELSSVIMCWGSDNYYFENLELGTETLDNDHIVGYFLNIKEKDGSTAHTTGGRVSNITTKGSINPVLITGQKGLDIYKLKSDYRGGNDFIAPGHVLYTSGNSPGNTIQNEDITIDGVDEGPNVLGWPTFESRNGGTLSLKNMTRFKIKNVTSRHPAGLFNSCTDITHGEIDGFYWENTDTLPEVTAPVVFFLDGQASPSITDITFRNGTMIARNFFRAMFGNTGTPAKQLRINAFNINVETDFNFTTNQVSASGVVDWRGSDCTFDLTFRPAAARGGGSHNQTYAIRSDADNNTFLGKMIGQYACPEFARVSHASGGNSNFARVELLKPMDDEDYGWQDNPNAIASNTVIESAVHHSRWWREVAANTDRDFDATLPTRGVYEVTAGVITPDRAHAQIGTFLVTWTDQAGTANDVQQVGTTVTIGSSISTLALTVTTAGVMTISWACVANHFFRINLGWTKKASFTT